MRITIIGGGPGGYTAAFHAARKGCDVTLIEGHVIGGTCLNRGCIPTKTLRATADALTLAGHLAEFGITGAEKAVLDLDAVRQRRDNVINILKTGLEKTCTALNVRQIQGKAQLTGAKLVRIQTVAGEETLESDAIIIAAGSNTLELPGLAFDHKFICSSDDALNLTHIPERLVIVGGGVIGCELASIYHAFGSTVTIVEGQERLLPLPSVDLDVSALLAREMRKLKIKMHTEKTLKNVRIEDNAVRASVAPSPFINNALVGEEDIVADMVLVTAGRSPAVESLGLAEVGIAQDKRGWIVVNDSLETSVPGIFAIGDIIGPSRIMLAHVAAMEGMNVVDTLTGAPHAMRYDTIPSAIFTAPEIGEVGLTEQQAIEVGHNVACQTIQMRELGKAHAMNALPGFFKIVADADNGRVLGVHIVGAHASDMLAEAGLAITMGITVADIAHTIHAHPTLAEGLFEAALALHEKVRIS